MTAVRVRVPGSTSNLSHGFDCMGLAVDLTNEVSLEPGGDEVTTPDSPESTLAALGEAVRMRCADRWGRRPPGFALAVSGSVPISRGLGSSATVLVGVATACRELLELEPDPAAVIDVALAIEGHPDNVVAATLGGFTVAGTDRSGGLRYRRFDPPAELEAVLAIPDTRQSTTDARSVLSERLDREQAVRAWQRSALITAAFASGEASALRGLLGDGWHEGQRAALNPGLEVAIAAADRAGALGTFLSGSGSTVLSMVTAADAEAVVSALERAYRAADIPCAIRRCGFDREGARLR